jgi:WD40 repeat protein
MFKQHTQTVRSLVWSESNNLLMSGSDDQTIRIWKADGTVQQVIRSGASVRAVAWSADGMHLAAGAGNLVLFYDAQGNLLAQGRKHDQMVTAVAWAVHGQGQIVSGSQDLRAVIWDAQQYQPRLTFAQHTSAIQDVAWAADGDTIASSSLGGVIRIWSGNSGREVHGYYFDGATAIRSVAFSPTGERLVAGGNDGVIRLWNNGVQCQQQAAGEFGTQCVWSPDGRFLLSGSDDNTISLWYPGQKQTPLFTLKQNLPARVLAWSPDGKQFASASGPQVFLWKLA